MAALASTRTAAASLVVAGVVAAEAVPTPWEAVEAEAEAEEVAATAATEATVRGSETVEACLKILQRSGVRYDRGIPAAMWSLPAMAAASVLGPVARLGVVDEEMTLG